jgi:hypothetical protein
MEDYHTKWSEHAERMEGQQIPEVLFMYNPAGKRAKKTIRNGNIIF